MAGEFTNSILKHYKKYKKKEVFYLFNKDSLDKYKSTNNVMKINNVCSTYNNGFYWWYFK